MAAKKKQSTKDRMVQSARRKIANADRKLKRLKREYDEACEAPRRVIEEQTEILKVLGAGRRR